MHFSALRDHSKIMWRKTFEHKDTVTPTYAYLQYVDFKSVEQTFPANKSTYSGFERIPEN